LRVAEQANEEKIIGKEHLPLDFEQAVYVATQLLLPLSTNPFSCGKSN
jgi:hypothetical protein